MPDERREIQLKRPASHKRSRRFNFYITSSGGAQEGGDEVGAVGGTFKDGLVTNVTDAGNPLSQNGCRGTQPRSGERMQPHGASSGGAGNAHPPRRRERECRTLAGTSCFISSSAPVN